jgi:hypothetical protein
MHTNAIPHPSETPPKRLTRSHADPETPSSHPIIIPRFFEARTNVENSLHDHCTPPIKCLGTTWRVTSLFGGPSQTSRVSAVPLLEGMCCPDGCSSWVRVFRCALMLPSGGSACVRVYCSCCFESPFQRWVCGVLLFHCLCSDSWPCECACPAFLKPTISPL